MEFYESLLADREAHPPGCFIIHIGTELADSDPKVKRVLENCTSAVEARFISLLQLKAESKLQKLFFAKHLTGLFCTSMCFCVIQSHKERLSHVSNAIDIILRKTKNYVADTK